tara:strand:- start:960 stop:1112 length:153 start_codon:yes stop_codon:yes gene_type:complete
LVNKIIYGKDPALDVLLEINDTEYTEDNRYWFKIEAWKVEPSKETPNRIR